MHLLLKRIVCTDLWNDVKKLSETHLNVSFSIYSFIIKFISNNLSTKNSNDNIGELIDSSILTVEADARWIKTSPEAKYSTIYSSWSKSGNYGRPVSKQYIKNMVAHDPPTKL